MADAITTTSRAGLMPASLASNPVAVVLGEFDERKYNLVTPVTAVDHLPPMHRISIQVVTINPQTDTYPIPGSKDLGVGKNALNRIAAAAGITWVPERSGQTDTWNDPYRIRYRATGELVDFNGRRRTIYGEKEIDLRGTPDDPDSWGRDTAEYVRVAQKRDRDAWGQIAQQRSHLVSMAETKAKLRAVREALSIKAAMPASEIAKPWVVPSLVQDLPMDDPEVRRMVVGSMLNAQAALYGQPTPGPQRPALTPDTPGQPEDDTIDVSALVEDDEPREPWDDEPATQTPAPAAAERVACALPIDLTEVPTRDEQRFHYVERLNALWAELVAALGPAKAAAVATKHGAGEGVPVVKWELPQIAALGKALKAELGGA